MPVATDTAGASALQFDGPVNPDRAPLPVWCGAYLLGGVFTLLWFMTLTGMLQGAPAVDLPQALEIELIPPQQPEAPPPAPVPPLQPRQPPPKPIEPPPQPQLLTAPNADESVPAPPEVMDPPPPSEEPPTASSAVAPPVPAPPIKVEPLFRLTRLPDFSSVTTLKYPAAEQNRGREGTVIAEFVIDEKGTVRDIKILKSAGPLFAQVVVDELSKTVFSPSYIGERAVAARFRREFQFKLD